MKKKLLKLFFKIKRNNPFAIKGAYFGSTTYEMKNFLCGIGFSRIKQKSIIIQDYPFEPSIAFSKKEFHFSEIEAICLESSPSYIKYKNELIFISKKQENNLKNFAKTNKIPILKIAWNWDCILEPFLDTEFDEARKELTFKLLQANGFSKKEVIALRKEVSKQMYKYNFDTMLWEWMSLGLFDVLSAMRVKYKGKDFEEFYFRAMEIELRM